MLVSVSVSVQKKGVSTDEKRVREWEGESNVGRKVRLVLRGSEAERREVELRMASTYHARN